MTISFSSLVKIYLFFCLYIYIYFFSFLTHILFCICHALANKVVCVRTYIYLVRVNRIRESVKLFFTQSIWEEAKSFRQQIISQRGEYFIERRHKRFTSRLLVNSNNNLVKFVILYIFYYSLFCYYVYLWWIKLINNGYRYLTCFVRLLVSVLAYFVCPVIVATIACIEYKSRSLLKQVAATHPVMLQQPVSAMIATCIHLVKPTPSFTRWRHPSVSLFVRPSLELLLARVQATRTTGVKVKVRTLAISPLTWVRLVTSSALQSRKRQLIGMSKCPRYIHTLHTFIWQQRADWPLTCCNNVIKQFFFK